MLIPDPDVVFGRHAKRSGWRDAIRARRGLVVTRLRSALFNRRAVVRFQIAERVLDTRPNVLQHGRHRIDPGIVTMSLVKDAALSFTANVAQRVISVRP